MRGLLLPVSPCPGASRVSVGSGTGAQMENSAFGGHPSPAHGRSGACLSLPGLPGHPSWRLTQAAATLAVGLQDPALVAGALHTELVLVALLAALEVLGTVALDLAGVIVWPQLHAQRARTYNAFTRCHRAVVAAATVIQRALVWVGREGRGQAQGQNWKEAGLQS